MNTYPVSGYEMTDRYHLDYIHAMIQKPHTIFIYWEVSNRTRWMVSQHFFYDWYDLPKIIRVYDTTSLYFNGHNAHAVRDIQMTSDANNWYIDEIAADSTYIVDVGTYTIEHQFIPLLRSNPIHTPRDQKAAWGEPIIGTIPGSVHTERITPQFFENFQTYAACDQEGDTRR